MLSLTITVAITIPLLSYTKLADPDASEASRSRDAALPAGTREFPKGGLVKGGFRDLCAAAMP